MEVSLYRRLTGSKTPATRLRENQRNLSGGSTARKGPIGSTNHPWWMKPPLMEVLLHDISHLTDDKHADRPLNGYLLNCYYILLCQKMLNI
ncbi:hypothetical protein FSZ17_21510 [Cytobacillus dafuensis]|uniref:Uncharacterized protein n=1 Tax=Cytobacillus dafuensis TaxID=1742359 RepID=A0A5B8ZDP9_CYTDA|nr:hypothetical protein FSZ17_21510 [Cytobacillus dafuensis]